MTKQDRFIIYSFLVLIAQMVLTIVAVIVKKEIIQGEFSAQLKRLNRLGRRWVDGDPFEVPNYRDNLEQPNSKAD